MLSTPVWGVAIRKAVVAEVEAPLRRNEMAVGRTPHEQRGRGTPIRAALREAANPLSERCVVISSGRTKAFRIPEKRKPSRIYGDISPSRAVRAWKRVVSVMC
jgi:hypothetical protein